VWLDGEFRSTEWSRPADAVTVLRYLEAHSKHAAIAGGALAPSHIAHIADGYRAVLDDRARTGFRGRAAGNSVSLGLEIDDVLDPALVGGELAWTLVEPWTLRVASAVDPTAQRGVTSSAQLAIERSSGNERTRFDLGGGAVVEPRIGMAALLFSSLAADRAGARWSARADVRAGTGSLGAMFGALHRLERAELDDRANGGIGAGATLGVTSPAGWLSTGVRARGDFRLLGTLEAGAPMGRRAQAAAWVAATHRAAAGAAEMRVTWVPRLHSALQVARMYSTDVMDPSPQWSVTAWLGATVQ
jgi:hypothetical protein